MEFDKRYSTCNSEIVNVTHPPSNYSEVFAVDIGSVGTLAVPGVLVMNTSTTSPCTPGGLKLYPSEFMGVFVNHWLACPL